MKMIVCQRDNLKCDLNKERKSCRHLDGTWLGKCFDRIEHRGDITELVSIKKIHDAEKDDEPPQ